MEISSEQKISEFLTTYENAVTVLKTLIEARKKLQISDEDFKKGIKAISKLVEVKYSSLSTIEHKTVVQQLLKENQKLNTLVNFILHGNCKTTKTTFKNEMIEVKKELSNSVVEKRKVYPDVNFIVSTNGDVLIEVGSHEKLVKTLYISGFDKVEETEYEDHNNLDNDLNPKNITSKDCWVLPRKKLIKE